MIKNSLDFILIGGADDKCPPNNICLSKNYFYIIFFILFLLILYKLFTSTINKKNTEEKQVIILSDNSKILSDNSKILSDNSKILSNENSNILINENSNILTNKDTESINRISDINLLPIKKYLENRDRTILTDPIIAPERRIDYDQYPRTIKNIINIPTRGYPDNYQLIGLLSRDHDEKILQLFGRPTYPGSNQYEYYVTTEQNGFVNKIPIETKGRREIEDNQYINIPILKGDFKVKLYNYNTPRYNPYNY